MGTNNQSYICDTGHCCGQSQCCNYYYELWCKSSPGVGESLGIPGSWLLPSLLGKPVILLGAVLAGRICFWVPEVILPLRREHSDAL